MTKLYTTLDDIAKCNPNVDLWEEILRLRKCMPCTVKGFKGDGEQFPVSDIGELGRLDWLCWTAKFFKGDDLKIYKQFTINCAKRVQHLMRDKRSIDALNMAQDYLDGKITYAEIVNTAQDSYLAMKDASDFCNNSEANKIAAIAHYPESAYIEAALSANSAKHAYEAANAAARAACVVYSDNRSSDSYSITAYCSVCVANSAAKATAYYECGNICSPEHTNCLNKIQQEMLQELIRMLDGE